MKSKGLHSEECQDVTPPKVFQAAPLTETSKKKIKISSRCRPVRSVDNTPNEANITANISDQANLSVRCPSSEDKKKKSVTYSVRYPVACERNAKRHTSHGNDVSKRGRWSEVRNEYPTARNPVKNKTTGSPLCVNSYTPSARAQNSVTEIFHQLILNYPALPTRLHPV